MKSKFLQNKFRFWHRFYYHLIIYDSIGRSKTKNKNREELMI